MTFYSLTICNNIPPLIRLYTKSWHYYRNMRGFHRTFALVWHANRRRLLLRTSSPVQFGTCICSTCTCWDRSFSRTCRFFRTSRFEHPSVLSRFCWAYFKLKCRGKYVQTAKFYFLQSSNSVYIWTACFAWDGTLNIRSCVLYYCLFCIENIKTT